MTNPFYWITDITDGFGQADLQDHLITLSVSLFFK